MFALNLSLLGYNTDVHFRVPRDKRKKICQHLGGKPLKFAGLPNHVRVSINHGKTCTECGSFEDGTPEFILVLNRINDLEKAVETSLKGHITGVLNVIRTRDTLASRKICIPSRNIGTVLYTI